MEEQGAGGERGLGEAARGAEWVAVGRGRLSVFWIEDRSAPPQRALSPTVHCSPAAAGP